MTNNHICSEILAKNTRKSLGSYMIPCDQIHFHVDESSVVQDCIRRRTCLEMHQAQFIQPHKPDWV